MSAVPLLPESTAASSTSAMTVLLQQWKGGSARAFQLVQVVHADFMRMAKSRLNGWEVSLASGDPQAAASRKAALRQSLQHRTGNLTQRPRPMPHEPPRAVTSLS